MDFIENVSRGGFGVVDKMRLEDGTIVARKTFNPSIPITSNDDRQKLLKRFQREVKFQSSFKSESICPILDSDLSGDDPWFTMPFADRTLAEEIEECRVDGTLPSQALADVLNAVEKLHELGFVHRDIKPQNVLLIDGIWKLTDFGLILPPTGTTTRLTSIGSAWGTPEYAAPEQSSEFHSLGPGADIYAFGCILHDIFGTLPRIPYAKQTAQGNVGVIIERCTELRPERRFVSITALRGALFSILSEPPTLTPSVTATDWAESIKNNTISSVDRFQELIRYIKIEALDDDLYTIFNVLGDDAIKYLYGLDENCWKQLIINYCEWITDFNFNFAYCDVLGDRIMVIFKIGDLEIKAVSVLAAAHLGKSHNRWYVMGRVLQLCGSDLDESVAERLCIEIKAFEVEADFRRCAEGISQSYSSYHPLIRETIDS